MNTRKKYGKEFKLDAICLVKEQGYTARQAAQSLGIDSGMLGRWMREQEADNQVAFRGNGKATPEIVELRRLREENRQLKMEREILKKAAAFFAKESN